MARPSTTSAQQRSLTLMEELEKLEQSITLTLQEIDHNFSRAHRIVTSQILPVVEDYANHSEALWESSKFWKQFFEASANVSLNSYEEPTITEETVTETDATTTDAGEPSTSSYLSTPSRITGDDVPDFTTPVSIRASSTFHGDESPDFETPQITPRAGQQSKPKIAPYASPYEKIRREVQGASREPSTPSTVPSTPPGQTMSDNLEDDDDDESAYVQPSTARQTGHARNGRTAANDPLMHRVLDKNYRIQATPHSQVRLPLRSNGGMAAMRTPASIKRAVPKGSANPLDSSPMMEAPQLNSEIFASPVRTKRIPGVSVLTPAKSKAARRQSEEETGTPKPLGNTKSKAHAAWDSESDEDDLPEGYSPPKTMQFHIPQSKLYKTPAKEASKRIVDDLLMTAGGGDLTDDSPSVVGRIHSIEDDTF